MEDAVNGAGGRWAVSPHLGVSPGQCRVPAGAVPSVTAEQIGDVWETEGDEEEAEEPERALEPIPAMPRALQPLSRRLPFAPIQTAGSLRFGVTLTCRGRLGKGRAR